jgi:hypothetical protein
MTTSSAQAAAILLTRDHEGIGASAQIRCEPGDKDTLRLAIDTYGFLIGRNESLSLQAFAQRIATHYDPTSPRNAAVIAALQRAHTLNLSEQQDSALTPLAA